jgi:hypothetical protein
VRVADVIAFCRALDVDLRELLQVVDDDDLRVSVSTVAAHQAGELSITSSLGLLANRVSWPGVLPWPVTRFVTRSGVN